MSVAVARVVELFRYPVKSMAGIASDEAVLGWHGFQGDRRFAFRRIGDSSGFPWLSASRLPDLVRYRPYGLNGDAEPRPSHVRTPDGVEFPIDSPELQARVAQAFGHPVELTYLKHGIFDDAPLSIISTATMAAICGEAGVPLDVRRFRPNVVVASEELRAFEEDDWVGKRLAFGDPETGPAVSVTTRDPRCMMINLDPETAIQQPAMMKAAVRMNGNDAGIYAGVVRTGRVAVGQTVYLD